MGKFIQRVCIMFFTLPNIQRISMHLESTLAEICTNRWARYLTLVPDSNFEQPSHLEAEIDNNKIFNTLALFRGKEHFSWLLPELDHVDPFYSLENARLQYQYYGRLLQKARNIKQELQKPLPNYQDIINMAKYIQDHTERVPGIIGGGSIELYVGLDMGGNLFIDFFAGFGGIVYAPVMALVGVVCAIPYCLSYSEYCGSPTFFLDTALYFCDSVFQCTRSVIFPLGMLYSAYMTDSYNPFTKGDVQRSLEGIISLASKELANSISSQEEELGAESTESLGLMFRLFETAETYYWPAALQPEYIIYLEGKVKVEASAGETQTSGPENVVLATDCVGKGHIMRAVTEGQSIFIPSQYKPSSEENHPSAQWIEFLPEKIHCKDVSPRKNPGRKPSSEEISELNNAQIFLSPQTQAAALDYRRLAQTERIIKSITTSDLREPISRPFQ
jgi:hypothetical protein